MHRVDVVVPILLIVAGVLGLFVPNLGGGSKTIIFAVAVLCAMAFSVLGRKQTSTDSAIQFRVSVKEISFLHYERSRQDRPPTTEQTTEIYDKALDHFRKKEYKQAARSYARVFEVGGEYWPAKVNQGFCYQATGQLERALAAYEEVVQRCPTPRFRRQALGNSGDILMAKAEAADSKKERKVLRELAYERFAAARAAEETFVSLYNLWQAATMTGRDEEAADLHNQLAKHPEYEQMSQDGDDPDQQ